MSIERGGSGEGILHERRINKQKELGEHENA